MGWPLATTTGARGRRCPPGLAAGQQPGQQPTGSGLPHDEIASATLAGHDRRPVSRCKGPVRSVGAPPRRRRWTGHTPSTAPALPQCPLQRKHGGHLRAGQRLCCCLAAPVAGVVAPAEHRTTTRARACSRTPSPARRAYRGSGGPWQGSVRQQRVQETQRSIPTAHMSAMRASQMVSATRNRNQSRLSTNRSSSVGGAWTSCHHRTFYMPRLSMTSRTDKKPKKRKETARTASLMPPTFRSCGRARRFSHASSPE
jgi:hypothetical protein